jgi:hypothetical protein
MKTTCPVTTDIDFHLILSAMLFGSTIDSASAFEMWKIFWRSGASPPATKPSDSSVGSLVSNTRGRSGDDRDAWVIPGTWTNCS